MRVSWTLLFALGLSARAFAASGAVSLDEDRFNVQEKTTANWVYTVGEAGFRFGDELRLRDPVFHGMRWSKWGDMSPWPELCTPQSTMQRASWGLVTAHAERGGAVLEDAALVVERSNCRLSGGTPSCTADLHRDTTTTIYLDNEAELLPGDQVVLVWGDVEGCWERCTEAGEGDCSYCDDCGWETPDRAFPEITWTAEECLGGACEDLEAPKLQVSADPDVHTVLVTAPSQAVVDQDFHLKVALLDTWGNAVASAARTVEVDLGGGSASADEATHTMVPTDEGWHDFTVKVHEPGVYRFTVSAGGEDLGTSNPVEVFTEPPEMSIYWGDIHVHHGYTWVDADGVAHDLNHTYARDVVGNDVVAESIKAQGIEIDEDALWEELQGNCSAYTVEGDYLVLLAFEWMGDVAAEEFGTTTEGHHNVYYDACEAPFGTHETSVIAHVDGDLGLWPWLDAVKEEYGVEAVTIPHAMRWTGYNYDVAYPGVQTVAEIYSEWGDNSTWGSGAGDTGELDAGSTQDMLDRGLRLGWIGASDNHDGWMGNPFSEKNVPSGLGAFIAPALTRADVFDSLRQRRTYATTGHRPIIHFEAHDGDEVVLQGQEYLARAPELVWQVHGTNTIDKLRIYGMTVGGGAWQELVVSEPGALDVTDGSYTPEWDGTTEMAWWLEFIQSDGEKAWSSPIWVTDDCDRRAEGADDPLRVCEPATDTATDTGEVDGHDTGPVPRGRRCQCAAASPGALSGLLVPVGLLVAVRRRRA